MNDEQGDMGAQHNPEDPMAKWFAQFSGGAGGEFDLQKMIAQLQQAMSSMAGQPQPAGIDWNQAKQAARQVVAGLGADPSPTARDQQQVFEADRLAALWLDPHLAFSSLASQPVAWSRAEWVEKTMDSWRTVAEPIVTRIADALAASFEQQFDISENVPAEFAQFGSMLTPILRTSAGPLYALQLSQAIGKIAGQVVSGSEIGLQLLPSPQVVLLPANVSEFAQGLGLSDDDVRLYLTVREGARQRLFASVGWLGPQMLALLEHYAREITIDVGAISDALDVGDMSSMTPQRMAELSHQLQGKLFSPTQTETQAEILGRLETLLALVEGWVDEVAANTISAWMPHAAELLAEAVRRRRATNNPSQQLFKELVGLEMRPRRVRDAANMWAALTNDRGVAGRDAVWAHPDLMPTEADLDDPLRLTDPAHAEPAADEMDLALAELLAQAEAERRAEPDEDANG